MGREEQAEEREVLDSIFPDEITGVNHIGPCSTCPSAGTHICLDISETSYKVSIPLEIEQQDEETEKRTWLQRSTAHEYN